MLETDQETSEARPVAHFKEMRQCVRLRKSLTLALFFDGIFHKKWIYIMR